MCHIKIIVTVQSLNRVWLFATPWNRAHHASLSFTIFQSLFKLMSIELWYYLSHPLLPSSPFAFNLSQHQGLSQWVGSWHQGARVLELRLQHQSFHEYSGLIFFRIDWFDLLAVQGTLKSLLQHNSKASVLQCSAFFMVQLSHPYMTTRKTTALTIRIFVSKVMSLLFNTLSGFVRAFLPRSNCLLLSWLQSPLSVQPCSFQFTMPELWIQPIADSAVLFNAIKLMIRGPLGQQGLLFLSVH